MANTIQLAVVLLDQQQQAHHLTYRYLFLLKSS